jgi:hypothetical protein
MKLNKLTIIFSLLVASLLITGCASTPIMFGGNRPQFVNNNDVDFSKERQITAASSGFQLLLVIPINLSSRFENAYNDLIGQAGLDYITDVKIDETWTWAFVGTVYTTTLTAKVYPRIKAANEIIKPNLPPSENSQKLRELKKLKDEGFLTDSEYEQKRKAIVDGM